ncbi:MAG: hypothetical protein FJW36_24440 [Acidobacteria bacterium]|nr:hypothetical protein [Acidobacteriota bacterium]
MNALFAIGIGLIGGVALGFGSGFLAALAYTESFGSNNGGSAMGGFFSIAPIGFLSGFLLTCGFLLRHSSPDWGTKMV